MKITGRPIFNLALGLYFIGENIYFRFTFCLDLMFNKDIIDWKFVCVGTKFLDVNVVLLHTKSEQKVIGN